MNKVVIAAIAVLLFTSLASAEPMPMSEVDYEGDWQIEPANGVDAARIHYSAARNAFRIDVKGPDGASSIIRDMASGELFVWGARSQGMAMKLKSPNTALDGAATGEREEVNGESCTIWRSSEMRVCMSSDNIPLRALTPDTAVQLINLERKAQDASLFQLPDGVQVMELPPAMLKQMEQVQGAMPGKNALPF